MKMGLLWYDADPKRSTERKIDEAAERYREKFGETPNTCYVSPEDTVKHPSLKVVVKPIVQRNHYLVGVDEDPELAAKAPQLTSLEMPPRRRRRKRAANADNVRLLVAVGGRDRAGKRSARTSPRHS